MGDYSLAALRQALEQRRAQRTAQAKIVEEIEAPRRRLAEIEAAEWAAAEALAAAEAEATQKRAELSDLDQWLGAIEPLEGDIQATIRALDKLNEMAERGAMTTFSMEDTYRVSYQCSTTLEMLAEKRAARDRLRSDLKRLGVK